MSPLVLTPTETQRKQRGHVFYPPKAVRSKTPAIGATEAIPCEDKTVAVHYFSGSWDWYVTEANWETGEAFGMVKSPATPEGEWGSFSLPELEAIKPGGTLVGGFRWVVERDCFWTPTRVHALS